MISFSAREPFGNNVDRRLVSHLVVEGKISFLKQVADLPATFKISF